MTTQPRTLTREEIYRGVRESITKVLPSVEPEEVREEMRLSEDLGAESIDLLDITMWIEKNFGTTLDLQRIFPTKWWGLNNLSNYDGETLRDGAVSALRATYPHVTFPAQRNLTLPEIERTITVRSLVNYVETKLGEEQ
ncbi:MAG: hypothetical protein KJ600_06890 [Nanoarchaeota archaeon]|nr:hypothetical protein [Nanoarchaeota archaeon]